MPINGRRHDIDFCIADIVAALNAANITTLASCCGHGKMDGNIVLEDGRILAVMKKFDSDEAFYKWLKETKAWQKK
jgi:biotin synthase-like enzyme